MNCWPKPLETNSGKCPGHSDRSRAPGDHWMPFFCFFASLVYSIPTYSTPEQFSTCFLFPPRIRPQELFLRIKRKKLVWKAAGIAPQTPSHPRWCKIINFFGKIMGFAILTFLEFWIDIFDEFQNSKFHPLCHISCRNQPMGPLDPN